MKKIMRYFLGIPFVRDVLTLQAASVFSVGINLVTSIVYTRVLGLEGYGTYAVVLAFTGTFSTIINWGQSAAMSTFFAEQYGRRDTAGMSQAIAYFIAMSVLTSICLLFFIWLSPSITTKLYTNPQVGLFVQLAFTIVILNAINGGYFVIFQCIREIRTLTILDQGTALLAFLISVALLFLNVGIQGIFLSQIIVLVLSLPLFAMLYKGYRRHYPLPSLREIFTVHMKSWKEYSLQGLLIGIDKNVGNLFPNVFLFILSIFGSVATVGIARIALQLSGLPRMVILGPANQLATTVLPTVAARGIKTLKGNSVRLLKHALFGHAAVTVCCMLVMPFAVVLLYGTKYAGAITPALWLMLIYISAAFCINNTPILRLFRRTYVSTIFSLISTGLSVLIFIGLLHLIDPLVALILATAAYYLFIQSITVYIYVFLLARNFPLAQQSLKD